MKTLVTGGAGFMGSHLTDYLIDQGHEVTVIDDLSGGLESNVNERARFIKGSIVDNALVSRAMEGQDVVYHLAAYAAEGLSHFIRRYNYVNNLIGSVNLINAAIKNNVKCFLFTSSMAVYGFGNPPFEEDDIPRPEDPYGVAKHAVEQDLRIARELFGLNYVIIRPHNIYGERQFLGDPYRNVIGIFMNRIMHGEPPLIYGDGEQTRAFSYIQDVIPCIAMAPLIDNANGQIINLGARKPYTINELAKMTLEVMCSDLKPVHVQARHEVKHAYCTTEKSEKLLGFRDKTPLYEGLKRMAKWAKQAGKMDPIVWEKVEIENNLPNFWRDLREKFPNAKNRINPDLF